MSAATYRRAGVDVAGADRWLSRMRPLIRSTHGPGVLKDAGAFAGLFRLSRAGVARRDPVLVASTDGVGTKLKLARSARDFEAIGVDVVAMNVNDVLVYGAQPLFFLDYVAVGRLRSSWMSHLLRGIVAGCRQSGCALLGGETAEMPGIYRNGDYDVAGFCVGAVDRARLIDGSRVRAGDAIVGLASSGVHANGFSLLRKALPAATLARRRRALMTPTRIYVKPLMRVLRRIPIHAVVHVTGGGLARRLPALVTARPSLRARLHADSWPIAPVFRMIQRAGGISEREMFATFNMGIGLALACRPRDASTVMGIIHRAGVRAWIVGRVESLRG